jgi:mannose-6-phosphate isomerase-like protein (cupin superfamily)
MIHYVTHCNDLYALIVSRQFDKPGIHFFTPNESPQQLGYMHHASGKVIEPHTHNSVTRCIDHTQEVLFIKKGKVRVDFYDTQQKYLESCTLETGDVILLANGGHGFEMLEETEMIEVKQGPYVGEIDRTRFNGIAADQARISVLRQAHEIHPSQ